MPSWAWKPSSHPTKTPSSPPTAPTPPRIYARPPRTAPAPSATSKVVYTDAADKENAAEVAKTLGLPAASVTKGKVTGNANVSVILGQNYKPSSS